MIFLKLSRFFSYCFVFFLPFGIDALLLANFSDSYFVYISDFCLLFAILFFLIYLLINLFKNIDFSKLVSSVLWRSLFYKSINNCVQKDIDVLENNFICDGKGKLCNCKLKSNNGGCLKSKYFLYLFFVFSAFVFYSLFFGFEALRFLEFFVLFVFFSFRIVDFKKLLFVFVISIFLNAVLGILQFYFQSSFGLSFLGESILGVDVLGVSKIDFFGRKLIRAYALFDHPNIFAAYLVFALYFIYYLLFSSKVFFSSKSYDEGCDNLLEKVKCCSFLKRKFYSKEHYKNNNNSFLLKGDDFYIVYRVFLFISFFVCFIALLLTFSRSAILAFFVSILFYLYFSVKIERLIVCERFSGSNSILDQTLISNSNLSFNPTPSSSYSQYLNQTLNLLSLSKNQKNKLKTQKNNCIYFVLFDFLKLYWWIVLLLFFLIAVFVFRNMFDSSSAISDRILLLDISWDMFKDNPFGIGLFKFTSVMGEYLPTKFMPWEFQPVHNFFILFFVELGLVGGVLILFLFYFMAKIVFLRRNICNDFLEQRMLNIFMALFVFVFIVSLFDHYFYSFYQGQVLFWFFVALINFGIVCKFNKKETQYFWHKSGKNSL